VTLRAAAIAVVALGTAPADEATFARVADVIPDAQVALAYATPNNFFARAIYPPNSDCYLLAPVARALAEVARRARARGLRLRLFDCYRPARYQEVLWSTMPVPGYVADPRRGSQHSRGTAVDLTLVGADGEPIEMPSAYDALVAASHHDFTGGTARARANRDLLRALMEAAGFRPNPKEWWHYAMPMAPPPPVEDVAFEDLAHR
jgi:D-alanyl-D-alanine dipeptidase